MQYLFKVHRTPWVSLLIPISTADIAGAAAAYSMRKITAGYSGPGIEVTRISDNATLDIGFDPYSNLLDTLTLQNFCAGTSGYMTKWYDQTGNGVHLTTYETVSAPLIVNNGAVLARYALPAPSYGGITRWSSLSSAKFAGNWPMYNVFAIEAHSNATNPFQRILSKRTTDMYIPVTLSNTNSAFAMQYGNISQDSPARYTAINSASAINIFKLVDFEWDGSTDSAGITGSVNGVQSFGTAPWPTLSPQADNSNFPLIIGRNIFDQVRFFNGTILEVIIYNTALSPVPRRQLQENMISFIGFQGGSVPRGFEVHKRNATTIDSKNLSIIEPTSPFVVVSGSGLFYEPLMPPDPAIWLDSSDADTVLDANGNICTANTPVATWLDKSFNGRHFLQEVSTVRPVLTGYLNRNYIKFTSANATSLTGNNNALTFSNGVSGITLFAVTQFGNSNLTPLVSAEAVFVNSIPTDSTLSRIKFMSNPGVVNPAVNDRGRYFSAGGRRLDSDVQDGGAPATVDTAVEKNTAYPGIMAAVIDYTGIYSTTVPPSGTVSIFFNGISAGYDPAFQTAGNVQSTNAFAAAIGRRFVLSTPYWHNGVIGEFVAYDRILTPEELNNMYIHLKHKWNLEQFP